MTAPAATYRLQLTPGFTLHDAARVAPYVRALGISHLYLSPILEARAGSVHGYDVTDPTCIRAELGGEEGFEAAAAAAREAGLGILLDVVPNHMAASSENPAWRDLLEFGCDSPHARTFDLSWRSDPDQQRLLLPVLGDDVGTLIDQDAIAIDCDAGGLVFRYAEQSYPLAPHTWAAVLRTAGLEDDAGEFDGLEGPPGAYGEPRPERRARARGVRDAWLLRHGPPAGHAVAALAAWNRRPVAERSALLESVLERQPYELAFWRRAAREVGYRRFFDVTDLAGVRVEDPDVYEATHALTLSLVRRGAVDGLRIDHVDGLRAPGAYLERLTRSCDPAPYVVVEKILAADETLPDSWPVAGTTGYEFANATGGWFMQPDGWRAARAAYVRFTGRNVAFEEIAYTRQRRIIDALFGGELRVLVRDLAVVAHATGASWTDDELSRGLADVSASLDVYRTYIHDAPVGPADRMRIERAVEHAAGRAKALPPDLLPWLRSVLLLEVERAAALEFVTRWQQFTGPVMAKGFEDTALYNDFTLTSANEVGGSPGDPVVPAERLHEFFAERARHSPGGLNATSTHDTKRSEDVRLRIASLTLFPDEWARFLEARSGEHGPGGPAIPSPPDRVLLFQTLLGTWPDGTPDDAYAERIRAYMMKATREAKSRTSWQDPDEEYEAALDDAVTRALETNATRADMAALAALLRRPAVLMSLAQTAVKVTAPGVPDFYQGSETWHHALVDPDNRAPVDFDSASRLWKSLAARVANPDAAFVRELMASHADGRIKVFVTAAALRHRLEARALYTDGEYIPLSFEGPATDVFAFARRSGSALAVTLVARPARGGDLVVEGDVTLALPPGWPRRWRDVLTGRVLEGDALSAAEALAVLPCALLVPAA